MWACICAFCKCFLLVWTWLFIALKIPSEEQVTSFDEIPFFSFFFNDSFFHLRNICLT